MFGPSHANVHSLSVQRRLPTEAHFTSAWWKRFITSGRSPFLLGHS